MTAPGQTTQIPTTKLRAGSKTFSFPATTASFSAALVKLDRTISGGLNSLPATATLVLTFDYSLDNGATWNPCGGSTLQGGSTVVKGVTVPPEDELGIGIGAPFPIGTLFQLVAVASTTVNVAGEVDYS